jgi:hypothetical protein
MRELQMIIVDVDHLAEPAPTAQDKRFFSLSFLKGSRQGLVMPLTQGKSYPSAAARGATFRSTLS